MRESFDFRYLLCNRKFWTDVRPRFPGIFCIFPIIIIGVFYTCVYVTMSTYFDTFSETQHAGYLTILGANVVTLTSAFLTIHFLSQRPDFMKLSYCIFIHIALFLAVLLGVGSLVLMFMPASKEEIQSHTKRYVRLYGKTPYMISNLFAEKKCCGIMESFDIISKYNSKRANGTDVTYHRIPESCCKSGSKKYCSKVVAGYVDTALYKEMKNNSLVSTPCGLDWDGIRKTKIYKTYLYTIFGVFAIFGLDLGIFLVLNYYIWYRFPRLPIDEEPIHFNHNIRCLLTCRWKELWKDLKEQREHRMDANEYPDANPKVLASDFAMRHEMMKQNLAEMRTHHMEVLEKAMHEREEEKKRMNSAQSASSSPIVSPASSSGSHASK